MSGCVLQWAEVAHLPSVASTPKMASGVIYLCDVPGIAPSPETIYSGSYVVTGVLG